MKNTLNTEPLLSSEYWALMRLLQTLENEGHIPGQEETDWHTIYAKLHNGCVEARKNK